MIEPEAALIDVEGRQAMLRAKGLMDDAKTLAEAMITPTKTARKKRSDAGIAKGPKPIAQKPGFLSPEQAARLKDLIDTKQTRLAELDAINEQQAHALGAVDAAEAELDAYLLELQGKK